MQEGVPEEYSEVEKEPRVFLPAESRALKQKFIIAVYKTIANCINDEIELREELATSSSVDEDENSNVDSNLFLAATGSENLRFDMFDGMNLPYLKWRLAENLFKAKLYYNAQEILNALKEDEAKLMTKCDWGKNTHFMEHLSRCHLINARCSYELFLLNKNHYHLEQAYEQYSAALSNFRVDMSMYCLLPPVLIEFARLLEHYGAFPAAMEIYNNVLRTFPTNRQYFNVLYRTSLIGTYISESTTDDSEKSNMLNQTIDMLQFLLEALPENINDVHIVFLYAKSLELSTDIAVKFRAPGVYQSLYDVCRHHDPPLCNSAQFNSSKPWLATPETYLLLGNYMVEGDEPILAKYCYELLVEKTRRSMTIGGTLGSALTIPTCLLVGRNYANFQNYEDATKMGELAFAVDHFHAETRRCLSLWSDIYKSMLERETRAIGVLTLSWKERCWTQKYRNKVKGVLVKGLEEELKENRFEEPVREKLAYYATERWRSRFLFENECARRIQHLFREKKKIWKWQDVQRAKYLSLASYAYSIFRKKPYDVENREEIYRITNHRLCPKKHAIKKVRETLNRQDASILVLQGALKASSLRKGVAKCIERRKNIEAARLTKNTLKLQCRIRMFLAVKRVQQQFETLLKLGAAAKVVQRYIRWRNTTFQHAVTRVINRRKREVRLAFHMLMMYFVPLIYRRILRMRKIMRQKVLNAQRDEELRLKKLKQDNIERQACVIQTSFRRSLERNRHQVFVKNLKLGKRKQQLDSQYSKISNQSMKIVMNDDNAFYTSPGIRQTAPQFMMALQKVNVYCDYKFESMDCMMLSTVLKNKQCKTSRLIMHEVDARHANFEFDLVAAISQCRSLRSLHILSGVWTDRTLGGIFKGIQEENPRLSEVYIEDVHFNDKKCNYSATLTTSVGLLLKDYFNYAVPGIVCIALHKCSLRSADVLPLVHGLQINSSIRKLILSNNLIEDDGFIAIYSAVMYNAKKTQIHLLDFNQNLIRFQAAARRCIDNFQVLCEMNHGKDVANQLEDKRETPVSFIKYPLEIYLMYNPILIPYELPLNYNIRSMCKLCGVPKIDDGVVTGIPNKSSAAKSFNSLKLSSSSNSKANSPKKQILSATAPLIMNQNKLQSMNSMPQLSKPLHSQSAKLNNVVAHSNNCTSNMLPPIDDKRYNYY